MNVENGSLRIRNAAAKDAKLLSTWWNDGEVMAHAGFPNGLGISEGEVIKSLKKDNEENRRLTIEFEDNPIGEMSYRTTDEKIAAIGIKICKTKKQNQGYGSEFVKMLMNHIFMTMWYDKIILDTNLENQRAQHVYEKLGFKKIRTNMNSWKNQVGELQSSVDYEISKDEYLRRYSLDKTK
jgi:RimJ/RimL family protein N-acetyltransferase